MNGARAALLAILALVMTACSSTVIGRGEYAAVTGGGFSLTAPVRGNLPAPGEPPVPGLGLPAGELLYAEEDPGEPQAWLAPSIGSDQQLYDTWVKLVGLFPETGLWPLVVDSGFGGEPAKAEDFYLFEPEDYEVDAEEWLLDRGAGYEDYELEEWALTEVAAPSSAGAGKPDPYDLIFIHGRGLLLVPATRPSDAFRTLGWSPGFFIEPATLAAVLESWEDRFGAYPMAMAPDVLRIYVSNPPAVDQEGNLANEHAAFCGSVLDYSPTQSEYAQGLSNESQWFFWWG